MSVRSEHGAAATGIGYDRRVPSTERFDILARKSARAFKITGIRVQGATTNLRTGNLHREIICSEHAFGGAINARKESLTYTAGEKQHRCSIALAGTQTVSLRSFLAITIPLSKNPAGRTF